MSQSTGSRAPDLLSREDAEVLLRSLSRKANRRRTLRRWKGPGSAVAVAAAVAVALALPTLLPRDGSQAVAAELRRFAAVAAEQPAPPPLAPGQYYYLREQGLGHVTGSYTALYPFVREYWIRNDGWGRFVETPGALRWPGPLDKARWEAEGSPQLVGPSDRMRQLARPELDGLDFATLPAGYDFETLPREPRALYEVVSTAAAESEPMAPGAAPPDPTPLGTFGLSFELLHTPLTPPEIRSALFEAMAYIPGITVVREKTIPDIGTGAAVFVESHWGEVRVRYEFLVDPETSELLGYQTTQLDRAEWIDADPPFVIYRYGYVSRDVVDSTSQRPNG
jgi:hypothetical protein